MRKQVVTGRILIFGDSHVHAIQDALKARGSGGTSVPIEARRLLKAKGPAESAERPRLLDRVRSLFAGRPAESSAATIGDTSLEEFLAMARRLDEDDVLVSVIGGNQHAVFSTIQHPRYFDFIDPDNADEQISSKLELVPYRALYDYFSSSLRRGDGVTILALKAATRAKVVHLIAPPPKKKNNFIEHYHDTHFASEGIASHGVSHHNLRMKFWKLQNRAIEEICSEKDIETLEPPPAACDRDGFLARDFYAGDATHANVGYGELVLRQLEDRFGGVRSN